MPKQSLNLSLDEQAIERGRRCGARHSTSMSKLVNDFLTGLPLDEAPEQPALTPAVRRLRGVAAGKAGREDYHRDLVGRR